MRLGWFKTSLRLGLVLLPWGCAAAVSRDGGPAGPAQAAPAGAPSAVASEAASAAGPAAGPASAAGVGSAAPTASCAPLVVPALGRVTGPLDPPAVAIEDEHGALAPFYKKVVELLRGERQGPLRVLVYGDSNLAADWLSGGLRRTLQEALGDGGHGFVALGRPWPGYSHMDVSLESAGAGWEVYAVSTRPVGDWRLGFGGIAVQSRHAGAKAGVATAGGKAPVGRAVGRVSALFLKGPGQGGFEVRVDGATRQKFDAEAEQFGAGLASVDVEDGPHRAQFVATSGKPTRIFGALLERPGRGVVVDTVGVASSTTGVIMRQESTVYRQSLALRGHDLVVMTHGTFDVKPWNPPEGHFKAVRSMVEMHREVDPGVALLITSPVDQAGPLNDSRYSPAVAAAENRAIALENKVAYWDLRGAMGGDRSIFAFHQRGLASADHIHLNEKGGLFMGNRMAHALWAGLARHLERNPACAKGEGQATATPAR